MDGEKNSIEIDNTYVYVGIAVLVILFLVVANYYSESEAKILGLTDRVADLGLQLQKSVGQLSSKTADVVALSAKIDQINAELVASRGLLADANRANQGLTEKVAALQRDAADAQSRLQNAQAALQVSQNDLLTARNNLIAATSDNAKVGVVLELMNKSAAVLIDSLMAYYSVNLSASQQTSMRIFADGLKVMFSKTDTAFDAFMQNIETNYGGQLPRVCADINRVGADDQMMNNISNMVIGQDPIPYCYTDYSSPPVSQGGIIATPIAYQGGVIAADPVTSVMTARQICTPGNATGLRAVYQSMGVPLRPDEIDKIRLAIKKVISSMLFQVRAICDARTQGNIVEIVRDALQTIRNIYIRNRSAAIINGMAMANDLHKNKYMF